jgi:hypothetical protein
MNALLTIEPFGFFSLDALKAGWYVFWRQLVRILPLAVVVGVAGGVLLGLRMIVLGTIIMAVGFLAVMIWAAMLVPQLASRWAEARYGYALSGSFAVWWGITWRVVVASLIAGVILTPPQLVATSLGAAYKGSALGGLGQLLNVLAGLAGYVVSMLATGWAMSKIAAAQISGLPATLATSPVLSREPAVLAPPAAAPVPVAAAPVAVSVGPSAPTLVARAPAAPPTGGGAASGKQQCPKCGLYETERGSVIGWYCTVCGWRESRR